MAKVDWVQYAQDYDVPESEKFMKRKYKKGSPNKKRKKSLRDHRQSCAKEL